MTDKVLLKIKRRYSKDESFKYLLDELTKTKFHNGELLSENAELKFNNAELQKKLNQEVKLTKDDLKEERFKELNKRIQAQSTTNKRLLDDINTWRAKYFEILLKFEKIKSNI